MATKLFHPSQTEFHNRFPENFLLVENQEDGGVVIRAAIDNYSERRKVLFIHEFASEGFIPDVYQFMTNCDGDNFFGVRWAIDSSWLVVPPEVIATSHRRSWELFLSVFAVTVIVFGWFLIRSSS
ncbi:MAG: hypothetical protein P4L99_18970 [Chthoniobacter sp.]|nr:hypothetical protein [Chthoniobacter sp.]